MRLLHYSNDFTYNPDATYEQEKANRRSGLKPKGFWVSVEGEDDWPHWCTEDNVSPWRASTIEHPYEVTLSADAHILYLTGYSDMQAFENRWGKDDLVWHDVAIDWHGVAQEYDGIIIAPYQWSCRMDMFWYYTWDVASGCIWNLSAIACVDDVSELEAAKRHEKEELFS